ncbi:hypothetical protein [Sulfuracidifex tepidarius]|uniref:Uncharacterized protein n=1 Tax=Sulfuracidifex tepidarius TaxID=1294262 RepID=A0A510DSU3_9CREN|nr:hypothetical protein [Sulfuracidifex tepidarius]BBG23232.1 hypothetical protein IC006_0516 [Sulfuracidifex tepidarius]BBG25981.1 hypothetical protein IC007_0486 [Sulfuracidifex tepidarius]
MYDAKLMKIARQLVEGRTLSLRDPTVRNLINRGILSSKGKPLEETRILPILRHTIFVQDKATAILKERYVLVTFSVTTRLSSSLGDLRFTGRVINVNSSIKVDGKEIPHEMSCYMSKVGDNSMINTMVRFKEVGVNHLIEFDYVTEVIGEANSTYYSPRDDYVISMSNKVYPFVKQVYDMTFKGLEIKNCKFINVEEIGDNFVPIKFREEKDPDKGSVSSSGDRVVTEIKGNVGEILGSYFNVTPALTKTE